MAGVRGPGRRSRGHAKGYGIDVKKVWPGYEGSLNSILFVTGKNCRCSNKE